MAREITIAIKAKNLAKRALNAVSKGFHNLQKRLKSFGSGIKTAFRKASRGVLALGAALVATVRHANQFRVGMASVSTMLGKNQDMLQGMTKNIIKMSAQFGMAKSALTKGMFDILSAGIPAAKAMDVLAVATKAAVGGATDTAVAVDGLTTILNAYSISADEAAHVSDLMFTIVKEGKITYAELSENVGKVAPLAKAAGLSIEELSAAIATMVKVEKPERAMTAISAAMIKAAESGESLFDMVERFKGKSLEDIIGAGISRRAAQGVAILANNFEDLTKELANFKDVSGAADEAFKRMENVRHWPKLWQTVLAIFTKVGISIDKTLAPAINRITERLQTLLTSTQFEDITKKIGAWVKDATALLELLFQAESRGGTFQLVGEVIKQGFILGAQRAVNILQLGFLSAWDRLKGPMERSIKDAWKNLIPGRLLSNLAGKAGKASVGFEEAAKPIFDTEETERRFGNALTRISKDIAAQQKKTEGEIARQKEASEKELAGKKAAGDRARVSDLGDAEEKKDDDLLKKKTPKEKAAVAEIAKERETAELAIVEEVKDAELKAVEEVAEARRAAMPDIGGDPLDPGAFAGESITAETLSKFSSRQISNASRLDAQRIEAIVRALDSGNEARDELLSTIAENTGKTNAILSPAISLGAP